MKTKEKCNCCGECGYFLPYKSSGAWRETDGDCANLAMNKECSEEKVDPFLPWAKDEGYLILQVNESEEACKLFRKDRTPRVKRILKENPDDYINERGIMKIGDKWKFSYSPIIWGKDIDSVYPIFDKHLLDKSIEDKHQQIGELIEHWNLDFVPKRPSFTNASMPDVPSLLGIIKPDKVVIEIYKNYEELEENNYKRENYVLVFITRYIGKKCKRIFLRFDKK